MKKLNKILILLFIACCLSCNTKHDIPFNQTIIKSISEEDENSPSRYFNSLFFCKCQNEEISILNIYEIREVYHKEFKQMKFKDFLTELFNQKLIINCSISNTKFNINDNVKKNYLNMTFDDFLNFYCVKKRENLFWLKNEVAEVSKNSVLYFLFTNSYITNIDDYNGAYVIKKTF